MKKILFVIVVIGLIVGVYVGINSKDSYDKSKYAVTLSPSHKGVHEGDKIAIKLPDQFGKTRTTNSNTKLIIISFTKEDAHTVRDYIKQQATVLEKNHILFLADISKVPVIIRNMFIIKDLKKSKSPILLIYDETISQKLNNNQSGSMVLKLDNEIVKKILYVQTKQDLKKLFENADCAD
jgi:hypothetical protein